MPKMLTILDSLLTQKCINSMIRDYINLSDDDQYKNECVTNLKLEFVEFLLANQDDLIRDYGIQYIREKYPNEYSVLYPIIMEYTNYGVKRYLNEQQYIDIKSRGTSTQTPKDCACGPCNESSVYMGGVPSQHEEMCNDDCNTSWWDRLVTAVKHFVNKGFVNDK